MTDLLSYILFAVPFVSAVVVGWRFGDDWVERFLLCFVTFLCLEFLTALIALAVDDAYAEKFELRKDSWDCSKSHEETTQSTYYLDIGGVQMPQTTYGTETVCDQWSRKS